MKILFITTVERQKSIEVLFPPLGPAYIASYIRREEPDVRVRIIHEGLEEEIASFRPDLLGISSVTQNFEMAKEYARTGKKHNLPVVIGGTHISSIPASMTPDMDLAVIGEGEQTFLEIIRAFSRSGGDIGACRSVSGVAYRENGNIVLAERRPEIMPLDSIPFPARDLLAIPRRGIVHLFSSRGCPYKCRFCSSTRHWKKLRFFTADYLIEELERVITDYDPITIGFYDDLFIASRSRLRDFAEQVIRRGIHRQREFVLSGRANLINEEVASLLKKMNVVTVTLGLESGSEEVLRMLKGSNVSVEANRRAVEILHRYGINSHGSFVIGSPGETMEDLLRTRRFIVESPLSSFEVYILTPYPGTPFWSAAKERGIVSDTMEWSTLNLDPGKDFQKSVILADKVTRGDLYSFYRSLQRFKRWRRFSSRMRTIVRSPGRLMPAIRKNLSTKLRGSMRHRAR